MGQDFFLYKNAHILTKFITMYSIMYVLKRHKVRRPVFFSLTTSWTSLSSHLRISSSHSFSFFLPAAMLLTRLSFCSSSSGLSFRTTIPSSCASRPVVTQVSTFRYPHTQQVASLSVVIQFYTFRYVHTHQVASMAVVIQFSTFIHQNTQQGVSTSVIQFSTFGQPNTSG